MKGSFTYLYVTVKHVTLKTGLIHARTYKIDAMDKQEYFCQDLISTRDNTRYEISGMTNHQHKCDPRLSPKYLHVNYIVKGRCPGDFQAGYKVRKQQHTNVKPGGSTMNVSQKLNSNNIMSAITSSIKQSKDVVIANQKGTAVLTVLRTSIDQNPLVPEALKAQLTQSSYSDFILGTMLNVAAQVFSENDTIRKAAKAANLVGTYDFANNFTQLEDLIEQTVMSVMEPLNAITSNMTDEDKASENE